MALSVPLNSLNNQLTLYILTRLKNLQILILKAGLFKTKIQ